MSTSLNLVEDAALALPLHRFYPLRDDRWDRFIEQHPQASIFHTSAWLEALHRTYGYRAVAYTTSSSVESLDNAILFCSVESWMTGRRLVSLPFSDHCEPLMGPALLPEFLSQVIARELQQKRWRYIELRPLSTIPLGGQFSTSNIVYAFHTLDLTPSLDNMFRGLHKSSIQRKIVRAERERLHCYEGSQEALLDVFYRLFELTRRRHKLPSPPRKWFDNLAKCFGPALKIRVAYKDRQPLAAMITIRHRKTMVYKYGCSDPQFHPLGSMPFLYWQAIQDAKCEGLDVFDFGRTDADQQGLITFKNRWGAQQSVLEYVRYSTCGKATHLFDLPTDKLKDRAARGLISCLPAKAISKIGQMLYGHVG